MKFHSFTPLLIYFWTEVSNSWNWTLYSFTKWSTHATTLSMHSWILRLLTKKHGVLKSIWVFSKVGMPYCLRLLCYRYLPSFNFWWILVDLVEITTFFNDTDTMLGGKCWIIEREMFEVLQGMPKIHVCWHSEICFHLSTYIDLELLQSLWHLWCALVSKCNQLYQSQVQEDPLSFGHLIHYIIRQFFRVNFSVILEVFD